MDWGKVEVFIPDTIRDIPLQMGIDEAGRGPVLGPMVYCGACAPLDFQWPKEINDSKQLKPEEREHLFELMETLPIGFGVRTLPAVELSAKMLSSSENLNAMSHNSARSIVQAMLDQGLHIRELYIDTVGPEAKYQEKIQGFFPSIKVTVRAKADATYKVVGAASIRAKVTRDHLLEDFQFEESNMDIPKNWGSGYPSDPQTKEWLEKNFDPVFGYPSVARFSWKSIEAIFEAKKADAYTEEEIKFPHGSDFFRVHHLRPMPYPNK